MQKEAKLSSKGQVTIPQEIRRALRLKQGDTLVFETDERGAHIRLAEDRDAFAKYAGAWLTDGEEGLSKEATTALIRELRGHEE